LRNNYDVLILASIVEKEARTLKDREIVSGIFLSRLKNDDYLQSCATVNYVLGKSKKRLSEEDISVPSPYNTYKNKGLPPGPISSPSIDSVKAVFHFKETDYYYFFSSDNGDLYFTKTLDEHLRLQKKIWGEV